MCIQRIYIIMLSILGMRRNVATEPLAEVHPLLQNLVINIVNIGCRTKRKPTETETTSY